MATNQSTNCPEPQWPFGSSTHGTASGSGLKTICKKKTQLKIQTPKNESIQVATAGSARTE